MSAQTKASWHTGGPWEVELEDDGISSGCTFSILMGSALDGGGWEPQHRIEYGAPSREESPAQFREAEANANLIAASPDLLDALKALVSEHCGIFGTPTPAQVRAHWEYELREGRGSAPLMLAALDAIAKAEGQ